MQNADEDEIPLKIRIECFLFARVCVKLCINNQNHTL